MGVGRNRGRDVAIVTPTNSFLRLRVLTSVPILVKIDKKNATARVLTEDTHTDRLTEANRLYNLSHAIYLFNMKLVQKYTR